MTAMHQRFPLEPKTYYGEKNDDSPVQDPLIEERCDGKSRGDRWKMGAVATTIGLKMNRHRKKALYIKEELQALNEVGMSH